MTSVCHQNQVWSVTFIKYWLYQEILGDTAEFTTKLKTDFAIDTRKLYYNESLKKTSTVQEWS